MLFLSVITSNCIIYCRFSIFLLCKSVTFDQSISLVERLIDRFTVPGSGGRKTQNSIRQACYGLWDRISSSFILSALFAWLFNVTVFDFSGKEWEKGGLYLSEVSVAPKLLNDLLLAGGNLIGQPRRGETKMRMKKKEKKKKNTRKLNNKNHSKWTQNPLFVFCSTSSNSMHHTRYCAVHGLMLVYSRPWPFRPGLSANETQGLVSNVQLLPIAVKQIEEIVVFNHFW